MTDNELLNKVFSDEDFPSFPKKVIGYQDVKEKSGQIVSKPIYSFFLDKEAFFVQDFDSRKEVAAYFTSSTNQKLQLYLYYDSPTAKGFVPHLIVGSRFL